MTDYSSQLFILAEASPQRVEREIIFQAFGKCQAMSSLTVFNGPVFDQYN